MFDLLLRRARLVDDTLTDIAIQDGKIAALGEISAPSRKTIELNGKVYVSAGWIDSHVHCYPNSPIYHDEPDSVGIATGVTRAARAGSQCQRRDGACCGERREPGMCTHVNAPRV